MPSKYWIKLYHEIIDDPKMMRMSEDLFAKTIKLFLLAGDYDKDGKLPILDDVAWRLRYDSGDISVTLRHLEELQIVAQNGDGSWYIRQWDERQGPMSGAERTRRYRKTARNEPSQNRHTDIDKDKEERRAPHGEFADD